MGDDRRDAATATRRDCLIGSAALILSQGAVTPAAAGPALPSPPPIPAATEAAGGCTPFRRVYLQK